MDIHLIVKLKSSFNALQEVFVNHVDVRSKVCDEIRTLVGKANHTTALVTLFDVDMVEMGAMMAAPEFVKMNAKFVEEIIPHSITSLNSPS